MKSGFRKRNPLFFSQILIPYSLINPLFSRMYSRYAISCLLTIFFPWKDVQSQVLFEEVSIQSGIDHLQVQPFFFGGGIAVLDFDNDGWEDVYFTGGENSDKLYRNLGNGQFLDVSVPSGISSLSQVTTMGVTAGDVNNDGFQDIVVATFFGSKSMLLINQGDGTFNHMVNALNDGTNWKSSASLGDVNKDGFLDIYLTTYIFTGGLIYGPDNEVIGYEHVCHPNMLYINNGNLTFTEAGPSYGVDNQGCSLSCAFTDFDNDLDVDINLANDFGQWVEPSALYENKYPDAEFLDVSIPANMIAEFYGMGIAIGDYDRDADLDYYQTNIGRNLLSRNDEFIFSDRTTEAGVENDSLNGLNTTGWGCFFFDSDNDAWPDLYVANGQVPVDSIIANVLHDPNTLFLNNGDGTFDDVSNVAGVGDTQRSRGAVYADFDKDGLLDIMVSNIHVSSDSGHVTYYHNISQNTNHWVEFDLEGVQSNRDAYGAHITIWLNGLPTLAEVDGGSSHASKSSSIVHFGVGQSTLVDSVNIVFPSGLATTLTDIAVNQRYSVIEDVTVGLTNMRLNNPVYSLHRMNNGLNINSSKESEVLFEIFTASGALMERNSLLLSMGENPFGFNNLSSPGVYIIRLTDTWTSYTFKLIL